MALEAVVDWIARDLKRGGSARQALVAGLIFVGLLGSALATLVTPFSAALNLPARVEGDRIRISGPALWLDPLRTGRIGTGQVLVTCRGDSGLPSWPGSDDPAAVLIMTGVKPCPAGQRRIAVVRRNVSLVQLARMKIFEGAGPAAATSKEDSDAR